MGKEMTEEQKARKREYDRMWRKSDKRKEWNKQYDKTEKRQEWKKQYKEKNAEKIKQQDKERRLRNKDKRNEYNKKYKEEHGEEWKAKVKKYNAEYSKREESKERAREIKKERMKTDLNYRIKIKLRKDMWKRLKNNSKSQSTIELLGCTIEEFKIYIEKQFKPGMSWENHNFHGWHIDHIRPCASFDLSDPEQQKVCFNYKNMQPLWAEENLKKGDRII